MSQEDPHVTIEPGEAYPLGPRLDSRGCNFSVFSEMASEIELCLFDPEGNETRYFLPGKSGPFFHGYLPGVGSGQIYGYRVHGSYEPGRGFRCNPAKLLLDPYARATVGELLWNDAVLVFRDDDPFGPKDDSDSAPVVAKAVVTDGGFDWRGDTLPRRPWTDTVIYELHVRGFTRLHPELPPELRGTYAGLAAPPVIEYLKRLGVTAVELLPIHHFESERFLHQRGLKNFWGYNPIAYFAPHPGYAANRQPAGAVREFKEMVAALHRAGIEVILDVVFNHTAEGNESGPTLCFRGLDDRSYYRHQPEEPGRYLDFTGCGSTVRVRHPQVLALVMDSLRYWAEEMHVDGFRFDLASALTRGDRDVDLWSSFLAAVLQDPVLRSRKLIAEPWDLGHDGYRVGGFPYPWSEWNGGFRDVMRDAWRADVDCSDFQMRFLGSPDLYQPAARGPRASINFVTSHDGFTLRDLVSYNQKHNSANGEDNRDGESHNRSWNLGVEGETDDPEICRLRARQQRNFLTTLLLSNGIPMLLGGDEGSRTQRGNNNAYCQDNEISWVDWERQDRALFEFTRKLIALRRSERAFRGEDFVAADGNNSESFWFDPDGNVVGLHSGLRGAVVLGLFLCPNPPYERTAARQGHASFCLLFNSSSGRASFHLPLRLVGSSYVLELATALPEDGEEGTPERPAIAFSETQPLEVERHSLVVLRRVS